MISVSLSPDQVEVLSILSLHAASGLSLGMSVVVLADVLPWRWTDRYPWVVAALLLTLWAPFAASAVPEIRRAGATAVSLYLAGLFVAYERKSRAAQIVLARDMRQKALAGTTFTEATCPVKARGNCVPAPRIPLDDRIGE